MMRFLGMRVILFAAVLSSGIESFAAPDSGDVAAQVRALVEQLDHSDQAKREEAKKKIRELGPRALDHLPSVDEPTLSAEQKHSLEQLVPELRTMKVAREAEASAIVLDRKEVPLPALLESVSKETGNMVVDLREDAVAGSVIKLKPGRIDFWPLIDEISQQVGAGLYLEGSDRRIGLAGEPRPQQHVDDSGAFRFLVDRVTLRRDFRQAEGMPICVVDLRVLVEPRLTPIQLEVIAEKCSATTNEGDELRYLGPERAYVGFEDNAIQAEFPLRFESPARSAERVETLYGSFDVLLPSQAARWEFKDLGRPREVVHKSAGLTVTLRAFEAEDDGVWAARVEIDRPTIGPGIDSHLQLEVRNEIFLEKGDGTRVEQDGGMNSQDLGEGRTEYEYLFVDVPGKVEDYRLVLKVPASVERVPISFEFKKVELP